MKKRYETARLRVISIRPSAVIATSTGFTADGERRMDYESLTDTDPQDYGGYTMLW